MSESILQIQDAEREGARLVIACAGISGSGKTYTLLQLAYGMANFDSRKVGFLDSENRRGRLYADALRNERGEVQRFRIADLVPPFSPERYRKAILEFQEAGVEVLVIDSVSHEWEGLGGCHDIADPPGANLRIKKWNVAKDAHKDFMNILLQSDMHILVSVRARDKVRLDKDAQGKIEYTKLGVLPIQEANFMFEMTASLMMWDEGASQETMKCPGDLRPILGRRTGYITAADGKAIRDWVDGAKILNPEVERARNMLRTVTSEGILALQRAWTALPKNIKLELSAAGGCPADLKAAAEAFDQQKTAAQAASADLDEINNLVAPSTSASPPIHQPLASDLAGPGVRSGAPVTGAAK